MHEDRELLDGFRRGDRAALARVYRLHAPDMLRSIARGFTFRSQGEVHRFLGYRAPHEQHDLLQELFVRAFSESARLSYDGLSPFGAYLQGILKNLVVDDFRKKKASLAAFGHAEVDADDVVGPAPSPEAQTQEREVQRVVRGFVVELPLREQRFVELRYVDGLGQEEVAKRMKVGRSRVRTWEESVRAKLKKHLAHHQLVEAPGAKPAARSVSLALLVLAGGMYG